MEARPNGLVLEIQEAGAERSAVSLECALESATGSRSGSELRSLARGSAYAAADGARTLRRLAERKRGGRSRRGAGGACAGRPEQAPHCAAGEQRRGWAPAGRAMMAQVTWTAARTGLVARRASAAGARMRGGGGRGEWGEASGRVGRRLGLARGRGQATMGERRLGPQTLRPG